MNKQAVILSSDLTYSKELLQRKEPPEAHAIIWTAAGMVLATICWLTFGMIDDVVKASGVVRPAGNISLIRNIVSGEIEQRCYKPGQKVSAGEIVLKIKPDVLLAQKRAFTAQITDTGKRLSGLEAILNSYRADRNRVPQDNLYARNRFDAYYYDKEMLSIKAKMANLLWEEEKKLPQTGTTISKLRQLEYEKQLADVELQRCKTQFLTSIISERDVLLLDKQKQQSQLEQIEEALRNTVLYAPVDGYIQEVSSLNKDDYIPANQDVLKIVPSMDMDYRIELKIPAKSAGKLKTGMKVKLRFPAFPYFEFRGAMGTIRTIEPDAVTSSNGELFFTVFTDVDKLSLVDRKGIEYAIRVGLQTDARIIIDSTTILRYVLNKMNLVL